MNRKAMAVAVAAAFASPAAFAQTTVTIGGTVNLMWDSVRASGATLRQGNLPSHDRVRDGAGSNIRFTISEDLGGGNSAFVQVESAVFQNADNRTDVFGQGSSLAGSAVTGGASANTASVWANRNSAIGIRSKDWGRFLVGIWDLHYDEVDYRIFPGWLTANASSSTLGVTQNFGLAATGATAGVSQVPANLNPAIGARYGNVIRWDSPVWSGFSLTVGYARPTDAAPNSQPVGATSVREGKKNRVWNLAARYDAHGLTVAYSYLQDKDAVTTGTISYGTASGNLAGTSVWKIRSHRLGVRYRFAMGLGIGALWDQSRLGGQHEAGINSTGIKRTSWAIPFTYETGPHGFYAMYGKARDLRGQVTGLAIGAAATNIVVGGVTYNPGSDSGASMYSFGYTYQLSKRTNVHASYQKLKNDPLARYDFFANSAGLATPVNMGADPRSFALGIRHTF